MQGVSHLQESLDAKLPCCMLLHQLLPGSPLLHSLKPNLPAGMLYIQVMELDSSLCFGLAELLLCRSLQVCCTGRGGQSSGTSYNMCGPPCADN